MNVSWTESNVQGRFTYPITVVSDMGDVIDLISSNPLTSKNALVSVTNIVE